jgi:hypothetical protein
VGRMVSRRIEGIGGEHTHGRLGVEVRVKGLLQPGWVCLPVGLLWDSFVNERNVG